MKRKKYATGTAVKNYMENPYTELANDQIAGAKARHEAESNPLSLVLGTLGQGLMGHGISQGGLGSDPANIGLTLLDQITKMAYGSSSVNTPVEVEGKEVAQTPGDKLLKFIGPSHEKGGIKISLPSGTKVYSDRIKVDGKTMADRKIKREKYKSKLEKNSKDKLDTLASNSLDRGVFNIEKQEANDMEIQEIISQMMNPPQQEMAWGGIPKPPGINPIKEVPPVPISDLFGRINDFTSNIPVAQPNLNPTNPNGVRIKNKTNNTSDTEVDNSITFGDTLGITGNMISSFAPYLLTLQERATDTPNVNYFENYGQEGLQTIDNSKQYVNQMLDRNLNDLELARNSQIRRSRNSARSVNTMRALDLAADQSINNARSNSYNAATSQMMNIMGQEAQMQNQRDQVVMGGEQARDIADRQDKASYYTQLAQNMVGMGQGFQETGKDLNDRKFGKVSHNLINQLSKYGIIVDRNGNLTVKSK